MTHPRFDRLELPIVGWDSYKQRVPDLDITGIGGQYPVQAEGTIRSVPFYFRARHDCWSMGIGGDVYVDPDWERVRFYERPGGNAGSMPLEDALRFIEESAKGWLAGEPVER